MRPFIAVPVVMLAVLLSGCGGPAESAVPKTPRDFSDLYNLAAAFEGAVTDGTKCAHPQGSTDPISHGWQSVSCNPMGAVVILAADSEGFKQQVYSQVKLPSGSKWIVGGKWLIGTSQANAVQVQKKLGGTIRDAG